MKVVGWGIVCIVNHIMRLLLTLITKANKVITRVDSYSDVVVLSTVAATDNDDNTRTYNVTVKVTGNDEVSATATGTVTVTE